MGQDNQVSPDGAEDGDKNVSQPPITLYLIVVFPVG
jgi:hypothetical protein